MDETTAAFSLAHLFYEEDSIGTFLFVTLLMGGAGSWLTGRAVAQTWRPAWQIVPYILILGAAIRFVHFSVFGGTLLSPQYYAVDTVLCMGFAILGFRRARVRQMVMQYGWINELQGPLRWRRRAP